MHDPASIAGEKLAFMAKLWTVHRKSAKAYAEKFGCEWVPDRRPWEVPCDIAMPTAMENELDGAHSGI